MTLEQICQIVSDNWLTLVVGIGSSALGSWGAQLAISRHQRREFAIQQINAVNAALSICFAICNRYMALKKQHVRPLLNRYKSDKVRFEVIILNPNKFSIFNFNVDFETFDTLTPPLYILERHLFEKMSLRGRALIAAIALFDDVNQLNGLIARRNDLILEVRSKPALSQRDLANMYFAATGETGSVDSRFRDVIIGISESTDGCIYFSRQLMDELSLYGKRTRRKYSDLNLPPLLELDWTKPMSDGLMPSREKFADWEAGFLPCKPPLWKRAAKWLGLTLEGTP